MTYIDRPIGIDLGTTNSEVAMLPPSERELLIYHDRFQRRTVPSAVAWDPAAEAFLVGRAARSRRGRTPAPIESIKRKMGQNERVTCGPHELLPEEVSAKILAELRARMAEHLGERVRDDVHVRLDRAVITVPAYFDAPQVEATRRAAELAGLDAIGILQEPTAAAIYHTWKAGLSGGNFLVYDFGGGTFDVSILRCVGGEYQVLAIEGDNYLGGDDLDRRFAEHLRKDLVGRGYRLELDVAGDDEDRRRFERIVHLAQEIKESLSTSEVVHVSKQDVLVDQAGEAVEYDAEIGRAQYEEVVGDLVESTIACCERALAESARRASVGVGDIDHVVLVGGSTRTPLVVRRVTEAVVEASRAEAVLQDEVDTCVALGAAVHAAQLGGLRLGDDALGVQVRLTSPLVCKQSPLKLALVVERAPEACSGVQIVAAGGGEPLAEAARAGSETVRLSVPVGEEQTQRLVLRLVGDGGASLGELPFEIYRGDVKQRASALSRPAVIAKDIALEVVRAGRRDRRVLLERGAGLPSRATQTFYTADQSGAVVLRLLQGRLPIKTLVVQVPPALPVGTAVELELRCDDAMRMEAKATVAGQELWATIEPPGAPRFDPKGSVEGLLEDAETVRRSLWGSRGEAYRREADTLTSQIREVVATDPDKLNVLCTRLQLLVDELRGDSADGLSPPLHHFEWELNNLRRVVYAAAGPLLGLDQPQWDERMRDIEARAQAAYAAADESAWRRVFNEVQALRETARQQELAAMRLDDPVYLQRRLTGVVHHANDMERQLTDFIPSATDEVRLLQLAERDRLLAALRDKVTAPLGTLRIDDDTDAAAVRRKLEQFDAELERIDLAVERIPALGLVTERGGSAGG